MKTFGRLWKIVLFTALFLFLVLQGLVCSRNVRATDEIVHVDLTWYLPTGNPMYNGEYPFPGAAACSWNFELGTVLVLPAGDEVICFDRGLLGPNHVDVFVQNREEGRLLVYQYGTETTVRVVEEGDTR